MNKIILKKIPVYILLIALLATFGFLTGFVYPRGPINTDITTYNEENPEGTEEDEEQIKDTDEWLAHLEHVLAMRSKHLVVLQRVIDNMIVKNPLHPSVSALQHALLASSKSVQKAQEAIDQYKEQLDNSDNNNSEDQNDETIGNTTTQSSDLKNNDLKENNGNGNNENKNNTTKQNNDLKENNGNRKDKGENKNKENNGKGKNK